MKRILSIVLLLPLVAPARAQSSSDTVAQKREVFVEDRYRDPDRRAGGENQSKFVLRINDFSKNAPENATTSFSGTTDTGPA